MRYPFLFARLYAPFDGESFRLKLGVHLRRWGIAYLFVLLGAAWFQANYALGLNASSSLPQRLFLIHKGGLPQRGDYVAFRWLEGAPYPPGVIFVKVLAGLPGDLISRTDRDFFVNGAPVGHAKSVSREGLVLDLGPTGTLPAGRYYVLASHPDSLDSRYQLMGWISESQIIGRAYALF